MQKFFHVTNIVFCILNFLLAIVNLMLRSPGVAVLNMFVGLFLVTVIMMKPPSKK